MADSRTLTRAELSNALNEEVGFSRAESARLVDEILDEIGAAFTRGENVKLSGFGSFILRDKGERTGRNPKTGVEVAISPRRVLTFRASQGMRARIMKGA